MADSWPGQEVVSDQQWPGQEVQADWPGQEVSATGEQTKPPQKPIGFSEALTKLYGLDSAAKAVQENASVMRTIPPSLVQGISGMQGAALEEIVNAKKAAGEPVAPDSEEKLRTYQGISKLANEDIQKEMKGASLGKEVGASALQSIAQNAPGFVASLLTRSPLPAVVGGAVSQYGQAHASAIAEHPDAPWGNREHNALAQAYAEGMFEMAPMEMFLAKFGKEKVSKLIAKYVGAENATEIPTTIAQDLADWIELNPKKSFKDWAADTSHDVLVTALSTPFAAGGMGLGAHAIHQANQAHQEMVTTNALKKVLSEMTGGGDVSEQLIGGIIDSIRSQQYDPHLAAIQQAQMQGKMANLPDTVEGRMAAHGLDALLQKAHQPDQGGITPDVQARRESEGYSDFGSADMSVPSANHLVLGSATQPQVIGLRMGQMNFPDGSVTAVGGNLIEQETLFPAQLTEGLTEAVNKIARLVGIQQPIIINLTQPEGQVQSWYQQVPLDANRTRMAHVITPRELPSFRHSQGNQNAIIDFVYSMTHEIGHALTEEQLWQGMSRNAAKAGVGLDIAAPAIVQLRNEVAAGNVTDETLALVQQFSPIEAELIRNWRDTRQGVLENRLTGKEFIDQWMGPRKFALGMLKSTSTQSMYDWFHREARNIGLTKSIEAMDSHEAVRVLGQNEDQTPNFGYVLSFPEYMAEQFSRASHDRNYLKGTMLGSWFQNALMKLREFFAKMKGEGIVKPNTSFDVWLDDTMARATAFKKPRGYGKMQLSKELKAAQKQQWLAAQEELAQLKADGEQELSAEEFQLPEEESVSVETSQNSVAKMVKDLITDGLLKPDSPKHKKLLAMLEKGQMGNVTDEIFNIRIGQKLNWDSSNAKESMTAGANEGQEVEAEKAWNELKTDSPFFKRWFGASTLVDGVTGKPLVVYRGDSFVVPYFDLTTAQFEKAIFFSRSKQTAAIYANDPSKQINAIPKDLAKKREATRLREEIQRLQDLITDHRAGDPEAQKYDRETLIVHRRARQQDLDFLIETSELEPYSPTIGAYYLRMENPFVIDFGGDDWTRGRYEETIHLAKQNGHDGLVIQNVRDPLLDTIYVSWDTTQAKNVDNRGGFSNTDDLFWDKTNPQQSMLARTIEGLSKISPNVITHSAAAAWHRFADSMVQLQQRAVKPLVNGELDTPMQKMLRDLQLGAGYKNTLMQPGEVLAKELGSLSNSDVKKLMNFLQAEWKGKKGFFDLQGWTANPATVQEAQQIWGDMEDGGRDVSMATGLKVRYWTYTATKETMDMLKKHGIDYEIGSGGKLAQLVQQIKQTYLDQFTSLQTDMMAQIARQFGTSQIALKRMGELYQAMQVIRLSPFMPQGRFGPYAIVVQEKKDNPKKGERKYETTRVEYFENRVRWQLALKKWKRMEANSNGQVQVTPRTDYNDYKGLPLQLPRNLLSQVQETGLYTEQQLKVLEEMMVPAASSKVTSRYMGTWSGGVEGGSSDLLRTYTNFIWHNANFIWKNKFRADFSTAISAQRALMNRAAKGTDDMSLALYDELERNNQIMVKVKDYVLYPPAEAHQLRLAATLVFLAYNVKTAVMNLSTMLNTYAALTTEFGEVMGHKWLVRGAYDASRMAWGMSKNKDTQMINEAVLDEKDSELVWMYNRAVAEGIVDQSYAYFLAGQANANSALQYVRRSWVGKFGHGAMELGMLPFRMIEKANRLSTMTAFFEAERARGADLDEAYLQAVKKTELTQGAYDAANRSEMFRGKKALFTMFYTYTQMMLWHTTGGYAQGIKADLTDRKLRALERGDLKYAERLAVENLAGAHAYTAKLLILYMMLGGLMGLPFAQDLMEVMKYLWRKLHNGHNIELDLRDFIKHINGGGHWYNDPELILHGLLNDVAGMDVSASLSLGHALPGIQMINRNMKSPEEWIGGLGFQAAGPFGGFTHGLLKALEEMDKAAYSTNKLAQVAKVMPGEIGALGRAYDAYTMQKLQPTHGVVDKVGARLTEDPLGSHQYRDLTGWEIVGMALNANPSIISNNKERAYFEASEQIYWRTRIQGMLDERNKVILMHNQEKVGEVTQRIVEFNKSLEGPYKSLAITGKQMRTSLHNAMKAQQNREAGKTSRNMAGPHREVTDAFTED